jgi:hypothetical protein
VVFAIEVVSLFFARALFVWFYNRTGSSVLLVAIFPRQLRCSNQPAQALLAGSLVDELRLAIAPSIAGGGRRLLDGLPSIQLESIRSKISPTGYLLVDYRVIR